VLADCVAETCAGEHADAVIDELVGWIAGAAVGRHRVDTQLVTRVERQLTLVHVSTQTIIIITLSCACSELQDAQLSPRDRAMRLVSSNLANYHATVQKLLIRQVLTKPMV